MAECEQAFDRSEGAPAATEEESAATEPSLAEVEELVGTATLAETGEREKGRVKEQTASTEGRRRWPRRRLQLQAEERKALELLLGFGTSNVVAVDTA